MSDVRRVEELLDRLAEERQGGARLRRTVSLLLVAMVAVFVLNVWWQISTFDGDELLSSLELHATTSVWPGLRDEFQAVGEEAMPAISQALADEAVVLLTRVTELVGTESETFQTNIGQHMHRSLEAAFVDANSEQDPALEGRLNEFSANPDVHEELLRRLRGESPLGRAAAGHHLCRACGAAPLDQRDRAGPGAPGRGQRGHAGADAR